MVIAIPPFLTQGRYLRDARRGMPWLGCGSELSGIQAETPENKVARSTSGIGPGEFELPFSPPMFIDRDFLWREEKPGARLPGSLSFIDGMEGKAWDSRFSAG
jgi:hypothetical protein